MKSKKQKGQVSNVAITLVIAAVVLAIGVYTFTQVFNAIPVTTGATNTTLENIRTTALDSFDLAVVGLIVLAAVGILSIVFLLGRGRGA